MRTSAITPDAALEPVLADRYRLVRRIATGGMGTVYEAEDEWLHRRVAIKMLREELAQDAMVRRRFEHEALLAAAVRHPGVAQVYDFVAERDGSTSHRRAFLVMELLDGEPLSVVMRRPSAPDMATSIAIVAGAADALDAAHRCGVVHRDVKPSNIVVGDDGRVTLTDFGVATSVDPTLDLTAEHGVSYATPAYMSPEQAEGKPVGPASDLYSLGVIAHQLLTGAHPFSAASPAALAFSHVHTLPPPLPQHLPEGVRSAIACALAKDPTQRPASGAAFARALRAGPTDGATGDRQGLHRSDMVRRERRTDVVTEAAAAPTAVVARTAVLPIAAPHRTDAEQSATGPETTNDGPGAAVATSTRRRSWFAAALAAATAVSALVIASLSGDHPLPTDHDTVGVTTTRPSASDATPLTVATVVAPTTLMIAPITAAPPTTVEAAPVPEPKDKAKGKGKGHGKG